MYLFIRVRAQEYAGQKDLPRHWLNSSLSGFTPLISLDGRHLGLSEERNAVNEAYIFIDVFFRSGRC